MGHFWKVKEEIAVKRLRRLVGSGTISKRKNSAMISFTSLKALREFLVSVSEDVDFIRRAGSLPRSTKQDPDNKHWYYDIQVDVDTEGKEVGFDLAAQVWIPPADLRHLVRMLGGQHEDLFE